MQVSTPLASAFRDGDFTAGCPTRTVLDHVMSRWAPLLLAALSDGDALRWSELRRRAEGVSEKMLAQTLRQLEDDGLVLREARPVVPPHVEYSLTPLGRELADHLVPLLGWVADHAGEMLARGPARGA
ncbi:helix-turn-helix domain-containing protein [Nocardioides sp. SYSU D00038]|uniref:winged helix-turn-helix transcriptional regulator n=1 Tax=Nocardioides sp. SYSU D00038 TaxID=2812554 RepID=UPI001966DBC9|nr:helix-turn-helix domain-containing protein [Nocardioides sp. SYSU D00038]